MIETGALVIAAVLVAGGVGSVLNGYRIHSPEQRSRAGRLWTASVARSVAESVVGLIVLLWIATGGVPTVWLYPILPLCLLPGSLVQWRMHDRMGFVPWFDRQFGTRTA
ncbi:hypothetical protein [Natronococcus sp.]|uniref:hypothetical protein n=1 Tax=Natronococcus sp. TaxID=35747 RepID=UPI0025CFE554|nr:hypothetical protein [Natronococcus sp.]